MNTMDASIKSQHRIRLYDCGLGPFRGYICFTKTIANCSIDYCLIEKMLIQTFQWLPFTQIGCQYKVYLMK